MADFSPVRLSVTNHFGLVRLEDDDCHYGLIIELADTAECGRALLLIDEWREFPIFSFFYLTLDNTIIGEISTPGYPLAVEEGRRLSFHYHSEAPGLIFHDQGAEFLYAIDRDENLVPLRLNTGYRNIAQGLRSFDWWLIGDDGWGYFLPVGLVQADDSEAGGPVGDYCIYHSLVAEENG